MKRTQDDGPSVRSTVAWFTGLSGAGKSSIASRAAEILIENDRSVLILDGDVVRSEFQSQLGFSREDIYENNRRFVALCQESMTEYDFILVPKISPFRDQRSIARQELEDAYVEVYVHASLSEVMRRDPKGLYRDAKEGRLTGMVGLAADVPYEPPDNPELVLDTELDSLEVCAKNLAGFLLVRNSTL